MGPAAEGGGNPPKEELKQAIKAFEKRLNHFS